MYHIVPEIGFSIYIIVHWDCHEAVRSVSNRRFISCHGAVRSV